MRIVYCTDEFFFTFLIIGLRREVNEDNMLFRNIPGEMLEDSLLLVSGQEY